GRAATVAARGCRGPRLRSAAAARGRPGGHGCRDASRPGRLVPLVMAPTGVVLALLLVLVVLRRPFGRQRGSGQGRTRQHAAGKQDDDPTPPATHRQSQRKPAGELAQVLPSGVVWGHMLWR